MNWATIVYLVGMVVVAGILLCSGILKEYSSPEGILASILVTMLWPVFLALSVVAAITKGGSK